MKKTGQMNLLQSEKTLYDYWGSPPLTIDNRTQFMLTYTGKKSEVVIMPPDARGMLLHLGDMGMLKGNALIDYQHLKEV